MHNRFSRTGSAALLAAGLIAAAPLGALAQDAAPVAAPAAAAQTQSAEIVRTLQGKGYTNIHDVDWDDGMWELEATSPAGKPVDMVVDAAGKIVHEEVDVD